jgi:hypothetical protein
METNDEIVAEEIAVAAGSEETLQSSREPFQMVDVCRVHLGLGRMDVVSEEFAKHGN